MTRTDKTYIYSGPLVPESYKLLKNYGLLPKQTPKNPIGASSSRITDCRENPRIIPPDKNSKSSYLNGTRFQSPLRFIPKESKDPYYELINDIKTLMHHYPLIKHRIPDLLKVPVPTFLNNLKAVLESFISTEREIDESTDEIVRKAIEDSRKAMSTEEANKILDEEFAKLEETFAKLEKFKALFKKLSELNNVSVLRLKTYLNDITTGDQQGILKGCKDYYKPRQGERVRFMGKTDIREISSEDSESQSQDSSPSLVPEDR